MLIFNNIESQSKADYAVIMLHGHGGNEGSLKPLLNVFSFKKNVSFYFLQAPYLIGEKSYSWSYEIKPGIWERDEPKKLLDVSSVTTSTITIGTGGAAVSGGGGVGIAGGLSSWVDSLNADVIGNGGAGKPGSATNAAGGTATGGDINITGGAGHPGAMAGSNLFGIASSQYSQPGQGYGCGGSNGYSSYVSGAGNNGIVVVWEYK